MKKILLVVCVILISISFFLPWVSVESSAISGISKLLGGDQKAQLMSISGYQVPILANGEESRLMISIIKIFEPGITDADKKSYLIWAVPILSIVLLILSIFSKNNKWVQLAIGLIGIGIFVGAYYKISTTNLGAAIIKVNIERGLWMIFYGYLAMGVIELFCFLKQILKKS